MREGSDRSTENEIKKRQRLEERRKIDTQGLMKRRERGREREERERERRERERERERVLSVESRRVSFSSNLVSPSAIERTKKTTGKQQQQQHDYLLFSFSTFQSIPYPC